MKSGLTTILTASALLAALGTAACANGPGPGPGGGGFRGGDPGAFLKEIDTNNDDRLSRDEIRAWQREQFKKIDTNGDGLVTEKEFVNAGPRSKGTGKMPDHMKDQMHERKVAMFRDLDTDHGGALTLEEFTARMDPRLQALDTNDDGQITADEMRRGMKRRGGPRH